MSQDNQEPRAKRVANLKPLTDRQAEYLHALKASIATFATGDAGTGKSYCAVGVACELLAARHIDKIIITRPAVDAEEDLGYLPGEISEKFAPYFSPVLSILNERLGASFTTYAIRAEKIVAMPLGFMRGHSFNNTFILLDEAQNCTPGQMKMLLTRIGEGTKIAINGDVTQSDIPGPNGLEDALYRLRNHPDVSHIHFERSDVVRSGFVMDVLDLYAKKST